MACKCQYHHAYTLIGAITDGTAKFSRKTLFRNENVEAAKRIRTSGSSPLLLINNNNNNDKSTPYRTARGIGNTPCLLLRFRQRFRTTFLNNFGITNNDNRNYDISSVLWRIVTKTTLAEVYSRLGFSASPTHVAEPPTDVFTILLTCDHWPFRNEFVVFVSRLLLSNFGNFINCSIFFLFI